MTPPFDIHTHRPPLPADLVSYGLHPWDTDSPEAATAIPRLIHALQTDPRAAAIGECGLDTRRGAPLPQQIQLLEQQIAISEQLHLPLILHIVGAWNEIIRLRRDLRPTLPWAIHGFRGKPQLALSLLRAGFHISLGPRHNPDTATVIPPDRLLIETDDDPRASIATLAATLPHYDPATTRRFLNLPPSAPATRLANLPLSLDKNILNLHFGDC